MAESVHLKMPWCEPPTSLLPILNKVAAFAKFTFEFQNKRNE